MNILIIKKIISTNWFIVGGYLFQINQIYVFYFFIFFYIIVLIEFTVLVYMEKDEVKEYRRKYLEEVKK